MKQASALPERYHIGKTSFYQRRDYLIKLGYNLDPIKEGRCSIYTDEQVELLDRLNDWIQTNDGMDGFPPAVIELTKNAADVDRKASEFNGNGELVCSGDERVDIDSGTGEEIYIDTNPLEDIREQNLRSVDVAAQYAAAQNLVAFNYLQVDYMKNRDFSVAGLGEEVQQSEQAVRQSFASMMEDPSSATKKMLSRLKARRSR
jgi:hypothetical protein